MMFFAWTAMSFGTNLLTFYTKYLPGEVYSNSLVIGLASVIFLLAGPLSQRWESRRILSIAYVIAFLGTLGMAIVINSCSGG